MSKLVQSGFSITDLLVTLSLAGILFLVAVPNVVYTRNQLRVTEDARAIAMLIAQIRAETIRVKKPTLLSFSANSISWDYNNDGTIDGNYLLANGVTWQTVPDEILINGFGLIRSINGEENLTLISNNISSQITVNSNGFIKL